MRDSWLKASAISLEEAVSTFNAVSCVVAAHACLKVAAGGKAHNEWEEKR